MAFQKGYKIFILSKLCLFSIVSIMIFTKMKTFRSKEGSRETELISTTKKATWRPLRPLEGYYPDQIYLFTGHESNLFGDRSSVSSMISSLKATNPQTNILQFTSLRVEQLRSVCWDEGTHVILLPQFAEFPDIHQVSRTDLKGFVSRGNNLVILGGFSNIMVLNEIFGFHLQAVSYQQGPLYKSARSAHNTPFEATPKMLPEVDGMFAVHMKSLPAGARSYYDSLGASGVFAVRQDLGMVTYLAADMPVSDPPGAALCVLRWPCDLPWWALLAV